MADVRRDAKGNVRRTSTKPVRTRGPKVLAQLERNQLEALSRLLSIIEVKQVELNAVNRLYNESLKELREEYDLPGQFSIDFKNGKITEASGNNA